MDFGDVIFFLVFVGIIISNIMKQLKKGKKQASEKDTSGEQPVKKSGWKNVLEQMLEEARKQMEESAEPEPGSMPSKQTSGWDDLMPGSERAPEKPIKTTPERKFVKKPRQPLIHDDPVWEKVKFRPECMRCNEPMKAITDRGIEKQKGLIYCDSCGEQHQYRILNGELKLKCTEAVREKSVITPERSYFQVGKKRKMPAARPAAAALPPEKIKIPQQMSREDLRNAVVWSEILGSPLGLRDLER